MSIPIALTLAGSDSSGGAGIQADLKTFSALGVYGTSVITAITAQNTKGVRDIHYVPSETVRSQIDAVYDDLSVRALKIGMVGSSQSVDVLESYLKKLPAHPIILDPVIGATSGATLMEDDTQKAVMEKLFPLVTLITPNLPEACAFTGTSWNPEMTWTEEKLAHLGRTLRNRGVQSALIKGGHGSGTRALDVLVTPEGSFTFDSPRCPTIHTHGSGCTFSAAITAFLAHNFHLIEAVKQAKHYVSQAILAAHTQRESEEFVIGHGYGPLQHFYDIWPHKPGQPVC
jgi:hydroxymethylpyrimidine/phosphomethylpyrimidine kinase